MPSKTLSPLSVWRRHPVAACLATCLGLIAPAAALAATVPVTNCLDSGSGSLRNAVASAATGDSIDMSSLSCSTITLRTGAITIAQADLTLNGPGVNNLIVTGKYQGVAEHDRIFNHQGTGTLTINSFEVAEGYLSTTSTPALGGCIYSKGSVYLENAEVILCSAISSASGAAGGGIFTSKKLTTKYSMISANTAKGASGSNGIGGAAYVEGAFSAKYSTISDNIATNSGATSGLVGGLSLHGNVSIKGSTISGNASDTNVGGIGMSAAYSGATATIVNSTVSGNHAKNLNGGIFSTIPSVSMTNSTIAFNTAGAGRAGSAFPFTYYSPGFAIAAVTTSGSIALQSTLISNNTYGSSGSSESDLSVGGSNSVTFTGANNFVRTTIPTNIVLPSDTIKLKCPLLGPLRNNGGRTYTHALLSQSPAIDKGGDNSSANLNEDQRGGLFPSMPYPYPRVSGPAADIGAYEVQQGDIIFNTSFETCPILF